MHWAAVAARCSCLTRRARLGRAAGVGSPVLEIGRIYGRKSTASCGQSCEEGTPFSRFWRRRRRGRVGDNPSWSQSNPGKSCRPLADPASSCRGQHPSLWSPANFATSIYPPATYIWQNTNPSWPGARSQPAAAEAAADWCTLQHVTLLQPPKQVGLPFA
ncbi:hypothetical protein DFJ74DRAFT_684752 [Hyaloraphidium curvatum]|nr:hypothetical protein DFJ74DRAFT_684752 [Hyaloraphidium curvatum]